MSDKKKCPFCEAIALQRFIEEHHSKPAGFGMALSAALVSYWEAAEAARRREYVKKHGLTLCADGFRRLIIRKEKDMAKPYKECPHCGAHLDSGEKCDCRAEEIETVHSQKCACGITEQDVESGWECPLDNPNETVKRCEDCAFAKETD